MYHIPLNLFLHLEPRKVNVKWLLEDPEENDSIVDLGVKEESVFNLRPHSKYALYQRGTILSSRSLVKDKFRVGFVSDLRIDAGKMILTFANRRHPMEVYPHSVVPVSAKLVWDFYSRKWISNEILLPPSHLEMEFSYVKRIADDSELSLIPIMNNNKTTLEDVKGTKSLWDSPSFELLGFAPETHRYLKGVLEEFPSDFPAFMKNELKELSDNGLDEGIWAKCYENRMVSD